MKAIVYHEYGSPDVLKLEEVDAPVLQDDEVLVRVRASSANPADWHFMRGVPYVMRPQSGLRKPKNGFLGRDLAGEVEAVGKDVTGFRPGDEVFANVEAGGFAEYASVPEETPRGETRQPDLRASGGGTSGCADGPARRS